MSCNNLGKDECDSNNQCDWSHGICHNTGGGNLGENLQDLTATSSENELESFTDYNGNNLFSVNLLLKSLIFGCVFYILSHIDVLALCGKMCGKMSKDNLLLVMTSAFVVIHYILSLFI